MRVIAGTCKGRKLLAVPGNSTRPTSDKVREAIFNMIGPFFSGGTVLDVYAGTGALVIEALSRGFDKAIAIDIEPKSIRVIKQNLELCGLLDRCQIYRNDARKAIRSLAHSSEPFDLVFLDPPYRYDTIPECMELLQEHQLLYDGAILVAEHDANVTLSTQIGRMFQIKSVHYGDTAVTTYRFEKEEIH